MARHSQAEKEFLEASIAVWRELDAISAKPEGYTSATALNASSELRKREQVAWERYRAELDAPQRGKGHPYSTKEAKIEWLIKHSDLWVNSFIDRDDLRATKREICRRFREAGMVAPNSSCVDIGIHSMMEIAIKRMKERKVSKPS